MKKRLLLLSVLMLLLANSPVEAGYLRAEHYTLEEITAEIQVVAELRPDLVELSEIGRSVEGRPLLLLVFNRPDGQSRPPVLIYANVHAMEWTGGRLALSVAQRLARDDGRDPWVSSLLDRISFYIIPLLNPDGYAKASRNLDRGFTLARKNARGVDINRNWPYPREVQLTSPQGALRSGADQPRRSDYRGPHPLSEPENQALDRLVAAHPFFFIFDLHTVGGRFSYPWSYKAEPPPHQELFRAVEKAFQLNAGKPLSPQPLEWVRE